MRQEHSQRRSRKLRWKMRRERSDFKRSELPMSRRRERHVRAGPARGRKPRSRETVDPRARWLLAVFDEWAVLRSAGSEARGQAGTGDGVEKAEV